MKRVICLFALLCMSQAGTAQLMLKIVQQGAKTGVTPGYELVDHEDAPYTTVNDSTRIYSLNIKDPESLFIGIDPETGWFTRVWLEPKVGYKEVVIDYTAKKTIAVINPTEEDSLFENTFAYLRAEDRTIPDSLMMAYIRRHPDSYLSLYFVSNGIYYHDRVKRIAALNILSEKFKDHPDYIRIKKSLMERKYANIGDPFKEFILTDYNNKQFSSVAINGKWILLHFWSNGCVPCVKEMDSLVKCYNTLDTSRIAFISIGMDDKRESWASGKATGKIKWTNLWQPDAGVGDLCLHYGVTAMPYFILFNEQKKIVLMKFGADELGSIKETLSSLGLNIVKQ